MPLNYDSPQEIIQFLDALHVAPRKRWGQNFLINAGARDKIIQLLELQVGDTLLEIGPGLGAMTYQALQNNINKLVVFEVDPAYQQILQRFFGENNRFELVAGDVLKTWTSYFNQPNPVHSYKIIGNLPYNISSAIIQLFTSISFSKAVLTVQKELADRLLAKPKSKNYSSLSVWSQCHFVISYHGQLKAGSFYPKPNVDSAIISLIPNHNNLQELEPILNHLVQSAFAHRRKILRHNWHNLLSGPLHTLTHDQLNPLLVSHQIKLTMRAEEITPQQYLALAKELWQQTQ